MGHFDVNQHLETGKVANVDSLASEVAVVFGIDGTESRLGSRG
jgi:hypothetical protein